MTQEKKNEENSAATTTGKKAKTKTATKTTAARKKTKSAAGRKSPTKSAPKAGKSAKNGAGRKPSASTIYPFPERFNPQMETVMKQGKMNTDKIMNEATNLGREQMEAVIKSSTIFAKGCEDILRTSVSLAQSMAEKQTRLAKEAMTSKSLNEWAETQSKIAQSNFEEMMNCATKISEMSMKLLTESSEPLNKQMTRGMKKASESMAA